MQLRKSDIPINTSNSCNNHEVTCNLASSEGHLHDNTCLLEGVKVMHTENSDKHAASSSENSVEHRPSFKQEGSLTRTAVMRLLLTNKERCAKCEKVCALCYLELVQSELASVLQHLRCPDTGTGSHGNTEGANHFCSCDIHQYCHSKVTSCSAV